MHFICLYYSYIMFIMLIYSLNMLINKAFWVLARSLGYKPMMGAVTLSVLSP